MFSENIFLKNEFSCFEVAICSWRPWQLTMSVIPMMEHNGIQCSPAPSMYHPVAISLLLLRCWSRHSPQAATGMFRLKMAIEDLGIRHQDQERWCRIDIEMDKREGRNPSGVLISLKCSYYVQLLMLLFKGFEIHLAQFFGTLSISTKLYMCKFVNRSSINNNYRLSRKMII